MILITASKRKTRTKERWAITIHSRGGTLIGRQAENEALLRGLVEDCDGVYGTLAQAIAELDTPRVKVVRGIPSFRGDIRLGDPTQYDTALRIQVERYYRTYVAKPPSASSFVMKTGGDASQPSTQTLDASKDVDANLTSVRNVRIYHVDDPAVAGGKRELDREELAKGYEYGRTAVHISESDENITKLETMAVIDLIGFIQADHVCFSIPKLQTRTDR